MAAPEGFTDDFLKDIFALFAVYVTTQELQTILEESAYEAIRASLSGATKEEVLEAARTAAASQVTRMSEEIQRQLAEKIATGLEEQLGQLDVARSLKEGLGLDSGREATLAKYKQTLIEQGLTGDKLEKAVEKKRNELITERAGVIAQTEMGRALEEGAFVGAKERGNTHKVWITAGESFVCDICEGNQAQGPIPIEDAFESGDLTPPAHPRCYCTLGYVKDTGTGEVDRAAQRARERNEKLQAAREAASPENDEG
jgi:hypothetical protein